MWKVKKDKEGKRKEKKQMFYLFKKIINSTFDFFLSNHKS